MNSATDALAETRSGTIPCAGSMSCPSEARSTNVVGQMTPSKRVQRICRELAEEGASIAWHHYESGDESVVSAESNAQSGVLRLCINIAGNGALCCSAERIRFGPLSAFVYVAGKSETREWRSSEEQHRFLTVDFSPRFLASYIHAKTDGLSPAVADFISTGTSATWFGGALPLNAGHEQALATLLRPLCSQGCCHMRCKGILLQWMAEFFMNPCCGALSTCERKKCAGEERSRRVIAILERNLAEPPSLEEIGREVGCSPFYLSRTFSREMGMTIPQYLRAMRMRHAADLLRRGKLNVTEVALEVGYSSLSHFSRIFSETIGSCPGVYAAFLKSQDASPCVPECPSQRESCTEGHPQDLDMDLTVEQQMWMDKAVCE